MQLKISRLRAMTRLVFGAITLVSSVEASAEDTILEEVVVYGIRASLADAMDIKKDAHGIVDAINSEDIGKFPDSNLAESLQRITGVSIDRENGEGARITVRGVGPDFNLVTLNGRQMPAASIEVTQASNSRAFDFANLAAESVAAVEVHKTSRANKPAGGIGALVNIKTTRPLDAPGLSATAAVKGVHDTSSDRGASLTPEISGLYRQTFADDTVGIALSASYQDREFGYNQAAVPEGWRSFTGVTTGWGTIPQPGESGAERIVNRPGADDIYTIPQNLLYSFNEAQRERTNSQIVLQWQPITSITTTFDHNFSENRVATQRHELSVWFNWGASASAWSSGDVASPLIYSEIIDPATADLAMSGGQYATKNTNHATGLNIAWEASDKLQLDVDFHSASAVSGSDSPYGSNAVLGAAGFYRGTTTVDFTQDFPVLSVALPSGIDDIDASRMLTTGSSFRNSFMKSEVDQIQLSGKLDLSATQLSFGMGVTDVHNRSAFANVQRNTWGGAGSVDDYPDDIWIRDTVTDKFTHVKGSQNPDQLNAFFRWDFDTVANLAAQANGVPLNADGSPGDPLWPCGLRFCASNDFTTDRRTQEETTHIYSQVTQDFQVSNFLLQVNAGLRYEKTEVHSQALVPIAEAIEWTGVNEFGVVFGEPNFTALTGKYDYWLPSLDAALNITDNLILRASAGTTIGRPNWDKIQGGRTLNPLVRLDGGVGERGDPGILPLESINLDLSAEWYYDDASYMSVSVFQKDIKNYLGTTIVAETPFDLPHPGQGQRFQTANAALGNTNDVQAIRQYIFDNYGGSAEVNATGTDPNGFTTGTIAGIPGEDPATVFNITVPANQRDAELEGVEVALQHLFGDSGFGGIFNFTLVDSDLTYDNANLGEQFALEGLSDSANLVGFYENDSFQLRLAYNWRDKFLTSRFTAKGPNPIYTEAYGQWDIHTSFEPWVGLIVFAEGINLTNEYQRLHGRTQNELHYVTQLGRRWAFGLRYKF